MSVTKAQLIGNVSGGAVFSGNVGIGTTTSPGSALEINAAAATSPFIAKINTAEAARIDSSGRLLVGTSSAYAVQGFNRHHYFCPSSGENSTNVVISSMDTGVPAVFFTRTRGATPTTYTVVQNGDSLGLLEFFGADGTDYSASGARIEGFVDGTPGANDMPGRLVFLTTADGAETPTERMRITSGGYVKSSNTGVYYDAGGPYHESTNNIAADPIHLFFSTNASYSGTSLFSSVTRSASSSYSFILGFSGINADVEFYIRGDGNAFADGSWNGGGADYAEYFEWSDGNLNEEDRRGISVVLDGDKIRPAENGEDPIGVISGNPSVVGDAAWNKWTGKHLTDDYGSYLWEQHNVIEWTDPDGKEHSYESWNIPKNVSVPANATVKTVDEKGKPFLHRKINPAYIDDQEYIPREQRPEWDAVGLMGKLRIRKGQVTGSRWIKMRDISDSVEEWLVR